MLSHDEIAAIVRDELSRSVDGETAEAACEEISREEEADRIYRHARAQRGTPSHGQEV